MKNNIRLSSKLLSPGRLALLVIFMAALSAPAQRPASTERNTWEPTASLWVSAWQGSPTAGATFNPATCPSTVGLNDQTIRNIVYLSAGGDRVRIRLSNAGGTTPLRVGAASVSLYAGNGAAVLHPPLALQFGGQPSTVIAAGGEALSDVLALKVEPLQRIAVSVFLPGATGPATQHFLAMQNNYLAPGDQTFDATGSPYIGTSVCWMFLSGVEVIPAANVVGTLLTLGDSITDGAGSTAGTNRRYPDELARRLAARRGRTLAVSNAGLSGNDLMSYRVDGTAFGIPAAARFARDVLTQPGAHAVILLEGINDIGANAAVASDLIQVDQQIILQAHAAGLKIYGATLLPFGGSNPQYAGNYGTAAGEQQRQALNAWIRSSGAFDGVIDFDKVVRDPQDPTRLLPKFDCGDHLHPGDAGYLAMADAVDLDLILQ